MASGSGLSGWLASKLNLQWRGESFIWSKHLQVASGKLLPTYLLGVFIFYFLYPLKKDLWGIYPDTPYYNIYSMIPMCINIKKKKLVQKYYCQ